MRSTLLTPGARLNERNPVRQRARQQGLNLEYWDWYGAYLDDVHRVMETDHQNGRYVTQRAATEPGDANDVRSIDSKQHRYTQHCLTCAA